MILEIIMTGPRTNKHFNTLFNAPYPGGIILLLLILGLQSCSGHYLKNRKQDALDIFTAEYSTKSYGVSIFAGPIRAGFQYEDPEGKSGGLRGGSTAPYFRTGFAVLIVGADYFSELPFIDILAPQEFQKSNAAPLIPFAPGNDTNNSLVENSDLENEGDEEPSASESPEEEIRDETGFDRNLRDKLYRSRSPFGNRKPASEMKSMLKDGKNDLSLDRKPSYAPLYRYTALEISIGAYFGIRLGINFGELVDFILGWTTYDFMDDDGPINPTLKKIKNHPLWKTLDSETKKRIIKEIESGNNPFAFPL